MHASGKAERAYDVVTAPTQDVSRYRVSWGAAQVAQFSTLKSTLGYIATYRHRRLTISADGVEVCESELRDSAIRLLQGPSCTVWQSGRGSVTTVSLCRPPL
jgi:hypothetical protein